MKFYHKITRWWEVGGVKEKYQDFAQAGPSTGVIYFQGGWAAESERWKDDVDKYNRQVCYGVIKLLHEFMHCITPKILSFHFEIASEIHSESTVCPKQLEVSPEAVGKIFTKKGEGRKGDMGFAAEEILTNGYRICPHFGEVVWDIESSFCFKYDTYTNSFVEYKIESELAFISNIADISIGPALSHFYVEVSELPARNKRKRLFPSASALEDEDDLDQSFESTDTALRFSTTFGVDHGSRSGGRVT